MSAAFPDTAGHWAEEEIRLLEQRGIMKGYLDGTFHPDQTITKAEAVNIAARAANLEEASAVALPFADVPATHWAYTSLVAAYAQGWIGGDEDRSFQPDELLTRSEAEKLLARALPSKTGNEETHDPDRLVTRAEFAAMTARYLVAGEALASDRSSLHVIHLARWGIQNDGTKPVETTQGINRALQWAQEQGIKAVTLPAGTYLIDKDSHISMVSDMKWVLGDDVIIQKETNGKDRYETLVVGPEAKNVTLSGGWYRGDRDTHNYSAVRGTHENGYGIMLEGAQNVTIEGVKATHFTGDGLCICGYGKQIAVLAQSDFESGSLDENGKLVADRNKIRTKRGKTEMSNSAFEFTRTIHFSLPREMPRSTPFHLYFFGSNDKLLKIEKQLELDWSLIEVPAGAEYFYAVFETASTSGVGVQYWVKPPSRDITVKDSEFAFNRRQGITIAGADGILIENNHIHDISGTAPQSGIDIEGGVGMNGHPNQNIVIRNNRIENNALYNVILYDGENVTVENNYLGPNAGKTSVGVAVSPPFRGGAVMKNNLFDGSKIATGNESLFVGNEMRDSTASLTGPGVKVEDMTFVDSQVLVNSSLPFGVTMDRVLIVNNQKSQSGLIVNDQPVHLKNVTIRGKSLLRSLSGNVAEGSIYENLHITDFSSFGLDLPRGTYKGCTFQTDGSSAGTAINRDGKYVFEGCAFITGGAGLTVANAGADVTVKDSSFTVAGNSEAIYVQKAKNIKIENNSIQMKGLTALWRSAIQINEYGADTSPADVSAATISGNTISANIAANGISTEYAGLNAPSYIVKNNLLYQAKLNLRDDDVKEGNIEK